MAETRPIDDFSALSPGAARLVAGLRQPGIAVAVSLAALTGAAWSLLAVLAAGHAAGEGFSALGPGMGLLEGFALPPALARLCAMLLTPDADVLTMLLPTAAMWVAMVFAMMLPAAAPLLLTYAEIADTAARKGEVVVSIHILAAGYLAVWLAFAIAAAALQALLTPQAASFAQKPLIAAAILLIAGAYQFSALKRACLVKCRRPFSYLFANWSEQPAGVFRLGLKQGMHCLGCCWALMLLMFAAGTMNLFAMAALTGLMVAEKTVRRADLLRRATGAFLLVTGSLLAALNLMEFLA